MPEVSPPFRVWCTRSLPGDALERLAAEPDVDLEVWRAAGPPPREEMMERAPRLDALLCTLADRIDAAWLSAASSVRVVSSYSVGLDHVDLKAATERKVTVGHTPGVLVETTADLAFALLLSSGRRIAEGDRMVRGGEWGTWEPDLLLGRDIHGATLGIVGLGEIGQAVARRARGFGMRVLGWTRSGRVIDGVEPVSFDDLLAESDFVSLHVALSEQTRGLLDRSALARMKPGAILVNTGRGGLVDEEALADALDAGQLAAAGLDVFEQEPLPGDHRLAQTRGVTLLPHIGSASIETRAKMADLAVDNLLAGLRGEPLPASALD
jgi:glyoxylate reductase